MNKFIESLRNNTAFVLAKAIDKGIDGREIGKKLDKSMDKELKGKSEKIQRGPITNLLLELIEGLWDEDLKSLHSYLRERYFKDVAQ